MRIDGLLEGFEAFACQGGDEGLALAPQTDIGAQRALDRVDSGVGAQRRAENAADLRLAVGDPAKRELVDFLAALIHPQKADIRHMVVAAGVDASGDLDRQLARGRIQPRFMQALGDGFS